jgi:pimeloyl-ACP methyl ester carboxylesterase
VKDSTCQAAQTSGAHPLRRRAPRLPAKRMLPALGAVVGIGLLASLISPGAATASPALTSARDSAAAAPRTPVLRWRACDHGFQCATARVPLNYRHPRGQLISIAVVRHLATDPRQRVGTLFVNGGGPSEQIEGFLAEFPDIPAVLTERFDIITFDPRGFGFSTPIRCFPSIAAEDKLLGPVLPYPSFPVGRKQTALYEQTYSRFDARCVHRTGGLLDHDSSADEARDMNLIRLAVGAKTLNYVGLSYGTGLGAIYANLYPGTVGRMVLDGNLNPIAWTRGGSLPSFVRMGNAHNEAAQTREFLTLCGRQATSECAFSAGSSAATRAKFHTLAKRLKAHPVDVGGEAVGYADLFQIVPPGDVDEWQPAAAPLQELWTASTTSQHGSAASTQGTVASPRAAAGATPASPYLGVEQSIAVLCADTGDPRNVHDYLAAARREARFGGFGEFVAWEEEPCADWPLATGQDRYTGPWDRRTADTILVIGNTGDPTTPYMSSVAMARDLGRAELLTVDGFGHTEFFNPSICASEYEFRYLITGKLPPARTVCPQTVKPFPAQQS